MSRPSTAARRYAEAGFQLAERDGALDAWATGLDLAAATTSDPQVGTFLASPAMPLGDRLATLDGMLKGRVPDGVLRLARLLVERRTIDRLPAIAVEYRRLFNRQAGIVDALVTSASPLTPSETDALRAKVGKMTDRTVHLRVQVDDTLIGGLTVRIGDTLYDASVRGRLERLREQLVASAR
jgi:F-type H+-transporting ATPase subunit delta